MKTAHETWQELSTAKKTGGVSGVILTILIGLWTVFGGNLQPKATKATKAYADGASLAAAQRVEEDLHNYQKEQTTAINRAEIWRAKREIMRLQRERVKPGNSELENTMIDTDIKEYEGLITCVQEGKDLCY